MSKGTIEQKERWALDLLTLDKIGAWAITEPNSGSDAFGGMQSTARRDGDEYVLNGSKTFITNGPYADTTVFICKLDEGNPPEDRKVLHFVLDKGMPGLRAEQAAAQDGPAFLAHRPAVPYRRARRVATGCWARPRTCPRGGRDAARRRSRWSAPASPPWRSGIVERCLELCLDYAKERVQFGKPIGEYQLIQLKLARMEVARVNLQNLVFRQIEMASAGRQMTLAEASACKLYGAQAAIEVALEAVQLFGGNGYMAEYEVEQLAPRREGAPDLRRHRRDPGRPDRAQPAWRSGTSA